MKEVEESEDQNNPAKDNNNSSSSSNNNNNNSNNNNNNNIKETILDLDGVSCEPTSDASTLWNFHCDGATYPARLVNLPCPIEVHKTHDHAMYYKSCDIAQMLIIYEDSMALDEADAYPKTDGYPSYYHSGITPPLKRVVERRFAFREHQPRAPPRDEVSDVEKELHELMCKISKEGNKGRKPKIPSLANQNKVLQEVEEVVVDYEPWMDDYGRQESGIEFNVTDQIASMHPEIWLSAEKIEEIKDEQRKKEEEEMKKKQEAIEKKQKKKKKKEQKQQEKAAKAAAAATAPSKKKGIASKKNEMPVDEVTAAASLALGSNGMLDDLMMLEDDDDLDLGFDMDNLEFDMDNI
jgi:transcription initiation factor TFIID subunit 7